MSAETRAAVGALAASVTAFAASAGVGTVPEAEPVSDSSPHAAPSHETASVPAAVLSWDAGSGDGGAEVFVEDPLREVADACLDGLAEVPRLEAQMAAVKVRLTAEHLAAAEALTPPVSAAQQRSAH